MQPIYMKGSPILVHLTFGKGDPVNPHPDCKRLFSDRNNLWIGPGSKWQNPFVIKGRTDDKAIRMYRRYVIDQLQDSLDELTFMIMYCMCKKEHCHGTVLHELYNERGGAPLEPPNILLYSVTSNIE